MTGSAGRIASSGGGSVTWLHEECGTGWPVDVLEGPGFAGPERWRVATSQAMVTTRVTMLTQMFTRTPAIWLAGSMRSASTHSRPSA
jgi:hypothetical protein